MPRNARLESDSEIAMRERYHGAESSKVQSSKVPIPHSFGGDMSRRLTVLAVAMLSVGLAAQGQQAAPQQPARSPSNLGSDANANPLRNALIMGYFTNHDDAKLPLYPLP